MVSVSKHSYLPGEKTSVMISKCNDTLKIVGKSKAILGEGPVWDEASDTLYWVDIKGKALHVHIPKIDVDRCINLPIEVGAVAPRVGGGLIAATRNGFAFLDPQNGMLDQIEDPEAEYPNNRFNDGTIDHLGNFIAGTMHDLETEKTGTVYCLESSGGVKPLFGGYVICNGPAFSPDGCTLYFSNSSEREILAFPYDAGVRDVGKPKLFTKITEAYGYPDGLAVDQEGCVWCALWDGGGVTRFSPQGDFLQFFALPVPHVTCCAFGGSDYEQLYITTASWGLSEAQMQESPLSGSLFVVTPGVRGMPSRAFLG